MNHPNVKWHRMTSEDVITELHTDAACGLNRKAARSRSKKDGKNTLFDAHSTQDKKLWMSLLKDPALWILLFVSVFAICFSRWELGLSVLLCVLIGGFVIWRVLRHHHLLEQCIQEYRVPWNSVIRSGKRIQLCARDVVRGDILLFKSGDIVPCDCRLLSQKDLIVHTLQPSASGTFEWKEFEKNADFVYSYGSKESAPSYVNMLYGGSRIMQGEAAAIAVEIGSNTFLGAIENFELPSERSKNEKGSTSVLRPFLRVYGILLMFLLLPLTVIGLLALPQGSSMIGFFLSLSALLAIGAPALTEFYFFLIAIRAKKECFAQAPRENRAVLKSSRAMDRLASLTDVFVLGTCGSSDGKLHLIRSATGKGELPLQKGDSYFALQPLCEAYLLLSQSRHAEIEKDFSLSKWDDRELCQELVEFSSFDTEAMKVRIQNTSLVSFSGSMAILEVQSKIGAYVLRFTEQTDAWDTCATYEADGSLIAMDHSVSLRLQHFYDSARADGCRVITVIKMIGTRNILLGALAIREQIQHTLPSVLEEWKQSGVRVSFFFRKHTPQISQYLGAAGLLRSCVFYDENSGFESNLTNDLNHHRVFVGLSQKEIVSLIEQSRKKGCRIAVMGNAAIDLPLMQKANLSVACDGTAYHKSATVENEIGFAEDGLLQSAQCAQVLRRSADVLIPRADKMGGGLFALLQTVAHCRAARVRMRLLLPLLASTQLLCVLFTVFSICFSGIGLMNPLQILIFGFLFSLAQTYLFLILPIPQNKLRKWTAFDVGTLEKTLFGKSFWLPCVISSFGSVLYCFIFSLCGVLSRESATSYIALSCVILQTILILQTVIRMKLPLIHKGWLPLLSVFVGIAVFLLLSQLVAPLSSIFGFGSWTFLTCLSLPIPILLFFGTKLLIRHFTHRTSK